MGRTDREGKDGAVSPDRRMTRRPVLGLAAVLGVGAAGTAALAGCGEPQVIERVVTRTVNKIVEVPVERVVEKIVEVPVERIVEKVVTVEVERREAVQVCKVVTAVVGPQAGPARSFVEIRFVTDHTAGPRGVAMKWGLAQFANRRPDIIVKLERGANLIENLAIQFAAGTAPHMALFSQSAFLRFHSEGAFTEITDELAKRDDFVPEDYYFLPDAYTFNRIDHSFPQPMLMTGPQFGMPFQIRISGFVGNISLPRVRASPCRTVTVDGPGTTGPSGTRR